MKDMSFMTYAALPITIMLIVYMIILSIPTKPFSDPLWEIIPTPNSSARLMRTPVPHGWLVTYKSLSRSLVFVPDEKHEWSIKVADVENK